MKIKRIVNGAPLEFELTPEERFNAYFEEKLSLLFDFVEQTLADAGIESEVDLRALAVELNDVLQQQDSPAEEEALKALLKGKGVLL